MNIVKYFVLLLGIGIEVGLIYYQLLPLALLFFPGIYLTVEDVFEVVSILQKEGG
jgi:hypothetical protein